MKRRHYSLNLREKSPTLLKNRPATPAADLPPVLVHATVTVGDAGEYRAIVTRTREPKQLGFGGGSGKSPQSNRRIGAQGQNSIDLAGNLLLRAPVNPQANGWTSNNSALGHRESKPIHTLDVTHREDESRVRQPNAARFLGIFRRLSNAFKQLWAEGRPKREATSRD